MDVHLLHCAYSFHTQPFQISFQDKLPHYLFRLQTQGECKAWVDNGLQNVTTGTLLLYAPGEPYQLVVGDESKKDETVTSGDYYLFCRGAWLDDWWEQSKHSTLNQIDMDEQLLSIWQMLILEKRRLAGEDEELIGYLLRALCKCIDRVISNRTSLRSHSFVASRMKQYVEEHATSSLRVDDVAEHVNMSVSRTAHLFKECYGKTIFQYAHEIRLSLAEEQMKYSRMSLDQIAENCGFGSYSYFYRVFRKKHGISPADYRKQHLESTAAILHE